jgi:hypothetical protein
MHFLERSALAARRAIRQSGVVLVLPIPRTSSWAIFNRAAQDAALPDHQSPVAAASADVPIWERPCCAASAIASSQSLAAIANPAN